MIVRSSVVTPISTLAVSLADFKMHIKWSASDTSEDTLMTAYIQAATQQAESFTRRTLQVTQMVSYLDGFSNVTLDVLPVDLTTVIVKYFDVDNVLQTLSTAEYYVNDYGADSYPSINFDGTMPSLYDLYEPVYLEFNAGYATLPGVVKTAIMMMAATYFEGRQNEIVGSVNPVMYGTHQLLYPYKLL